MGSSDLNLDLLGLPALRFVDCPGLIQVVTVLVPLGQEVYRLFYKRQLHSHHAVLQINSDTVLDHLLLEGFLKTLSLSSAGELAGGTVGALVASYVPDDRYVVFIKQPFQFGEGDGRLMAAATVPTETLLVTVADHGGIRDRGRHPNLL